MRAFLYLIFWSWVNLVRVKLLRLKKPKYLAGALAGGAYMYFFFLRPMIQGHGKNGYVGFLQGLEGIPDAAILVETMVAVGLLGYVVILWLLPGGGPALDFTQAEIAFFFPAPLTRRSLLHFRLLKMQGPMLMSAGMLWLFSGRSLNSSADGGRGWPLIGWWLLLTNIQLQIMLVAFARAKLAGGGRTDWSRRLVVLGALGVIIVLSYIWARSTWPAFPGPGDRSFQTVMEYARAVTNTGPLFWVLLPFRFIAGPMLAGGRDDLLARALPAAGILLLQYVWLSQHVAGFEDASIARSEKRATAIRAVQAGQWYAAQGVTAGASDPFRLGAKGSKAVAIFWKNLVAARVLFSFGFWFVLLGVVAVVGTVGSMVPGGIVATKICGGVCMGVFIMTAVMGANVFPLDLRHDYPMLDVMKTYPMRGWELLLGEIMAPAALFTVLQWSCLALSQFFLRDSGPFASHAALKGPVLALTVAAFVPCWNLLAFLVNNGIHLVFPAWARPGPQMGQGMDVMGQQILMMLGQILAMFVFCLVPGAVCAMFVFIAKRWLGVPQLILGVGCIAIPLIVIELGAALAMLGDYLERLDVSEERADSA